MDARRGGVASTTASVVARAVVTWDQDAGGFVGTAFDGFVRTPMPGDGVSDVARNTLQLSGLLGTVRFADLVKFDHPADAERPGEGTLWYTPTVLAADAVGGGFVEFFRFQIDLDGTIGTREFGQVFRPDPQFPGRTILGFRRRDPVTGASSLNIPDVTVLRTSINVIPAPGVFVLALGAAALRRRRAGFGFARRAGA